MKSVPTCPGGGSYDMTYFFDGDSRSYEVRVRCPKHGVAWEIFKMAGNLDDSEKLAAEIGRINSKKAAEFGTELLVKLMACRERANEIIRMVQNDNLNEAIAKFREAQKIDGRLGEAYTVLAHALADSGHSTESVALIREGAEIYPKWEALKESAFKAEPADSEKPSPADKPKEKSKEKPKDKKK